jgi:uncharacterized MnhB-related membrane protein
MIVELDLIFLTLLVITALGAILVKDLLSAVIIFAAYSFFMAIAFAVLNAVDAALTEAAVGAGITTLLFIVALHQIGRRVKN